MLVTICRYSYYDETRQPRFFGHLEARPEGNFLEPNRAFDPSKVEVGDVVAVLMDEEDAREWGRAFDIAKVTTKRPGRSNRQVGLLVEYYTSLAPGDGTGVPASQDAQMLGPWKLEEAPQKGEVLEENLLCGCWLDDPDGGPSLIHPDYIDRLREELRRHQETGL